MTNTVPENIFIYVNIQLICNTLLCDSNWVSFNVLLEEPGGILEKEDTAITIIFLERGSWMNIRKVSSGESDGDSAPFKEQVRLCQLNLVTQPQLLGFTCIREMSNRCPFGCDRSIWMRCPFLNAQMSLWMRCTATFKIGPLRRGNW